MYVAEQGEVELTIVDENDKVSIEKFTDANDAIAAYEFESVVNTVYV
jgi:hypothetical protein